MGDADAAFEQAHRVLVEHVAHQAVALVYVQLAAFTKAADANALRDRLRAAGFSAFTEVVNTDKGSLTRVRVGPVLNRAEADQLKAQVKSKVGLDGIVRPHP